MRKPIAIAVTGLVAAATVATVTVAQRRREVPAATPTGEAASCIPIIQIRETRVRDDKTIDFVMNNRHVYRNTLPSDCPELGFEQAFSYATSLSELCSTDIITVYRNGGPPVRGASCGLGKFQPVQLAPKAK